MSLEVTEKNKLSSWSISEELIDWLVDNIPKKSTILELGSGFGTFYLTEHYNVYSVENDPNWVNKDPKSNYIYAPLVEGWYDVEILKKNLPKEYDVLIIDGPIREKRIGVMNNLNLFNFNCIVIVDDTHREIDKLICDEISKIYNKKITEYSTKNKKFSILM
jgi:hypothetical protein